MELYQRTWLTPAGERLTEWVPVPRPVPLRTVIRGALLNALAYTGGDQRKAAITLGLPNANFSRWLVSYDIPTARGAVATGRRSLSTRAARLMAS